MKAKTQAKTRSSVMRNNARSLSHAKITLAPIGKVLGGRMQTGIWTGASLILLAGALQGTFAVPMKYARRWNHENIWLVFASSGLVLFPWLLTVATVPSIAEVYRATSGATLAAITISGLGWGIGATLTGIGLKMVGISLGLGVILGLSASVGSFIPFVVLAPDQLFTARGTAYLAGTAVMFAGIAWIAVAGSMRDKALGGAQTGGRSSFAVGMAVRIASGLLSSMLNFSFAFGSETVQHARELGASAVWAANVASTPAIKSGFLANLIYCAYHGFRSDFSFSHGAGADKFGWGGDAAVGQACSAH